MERETAVARKQVEDAEAAIRQEQEDKGTAENSELRTREPERMFEEIMVVIGHSMSHLASSDDWEDGQDEGDEQTEQGRLSRYDEPGWVMGTISTTVQQRMERFGQKEMRLDKSTQPGGGVVANHFAAWDKKYGTSELMVLAVV